MSNITTNRPDSGGSPGRASFWFGLALCLLGPALVAAQFRLKHLIVPWYSPALATLGGVLVLVSLARRPSVLRAIALVVVASFAAFQWVFVGSLIKLPAYDGPVQAGRAFPAFRSTLADGRPFTDADFRDGSRHVMVFFRGRW